MSDDEQKDENRLIAERRGKLDTLREAGNAYPNDFRRNAIAAELHQTFGAQDDDALREEQVEVSVSGRMMAKRVMGKASFVKVQDRSGEIQLQHCEFGIMLRRHALITEVSIDFVDAFHAADY